jgi:hypothetical protein
MLSIRFPWKDVLACCQPVVESLSEVTAVVLGCSVTFKLVMSIFQLVTRQTTEDLTFLLVVA